MGKTIGRSPVTREEDRVGGSRRSKEPPGLEVGVSAGQGGDSRGQ